MYHLQKFCQSCRASLAADAFFCDECGSPVIQGSSTDDSGTVSRTTSQLSRPSVPMQPDWYVYKDGQNIGPISEDQLRNEILNGRFHRDDLGCKVGDSEWKELGVLFGGGSPAAAAPPPPPPIVYQPAPLVRQQQPVRQPEVVYHPTNSRSSSNSDVGKVMMYESNKKSVGVAYLLWFFFGMLGAHRFYIGETGTGTAILLITICSIFLKFVLIGFVTIFISVTWVFVDLFLIPSLVKKQNNELANRLNIAY